MSKTVLPYAVFRRITGKRNLRNTYIKYIMTGAARGRDGIIPINLYDDIDNICMLISEKARNGNYRFTAYRQLLQSKGSARAPRVISIPTARDRILLKALSELISAIFPECHGGMPQQKVHLVNNAIQSASFDSYIRLDIKNFYPSIKHEDVLSQLSKRIRKKEILKLIKRSISTPTLSDRSKRTGSGVTKGIPQGLSVSNHLAEISLMEIDALFDSKSDISYIRYVDDVIILCDRSKQQEIYDEFLYLCAQKSLEIHKISDEVSKSKFGKVGDRLEFLGYVFEGDLITVRDESILNIQYSISRIFSKYRKDKKSVAEGSKASLKLREKFLWSINLLITGCVFDGQNRGWLFYYSQINDLKVLGSLDASIQKNLKRFHFEKPINTKTFIRAYWNILHSNTKKSKYIPNFDSYEVLEMRRMLSSIFDYVEIEKMSDELVRVNFHREINRTVSNFEKDVVGRS